MCWFAVVGVDMSKAALVPTVFAAYTKQWLHGRPAPAFAVSPNRYPLLVAAAPGKALFAVSDGHCACDLVGRAPADRERNLRRLRRHGLKGAKLERAIRQKDEQRAAQPDEAASFREALALLVREAGSAVLYIHREPGELPQLFVRARLTLAELEEATRLPTEALVEIGSA